MRRNDQSIKRLGAWHGCRSTPISRSSTADTPCSAKISSLIGRATARPRGAVTVKTIELPVRRCSKTLCRSRAQGSGADFLACAPTGAGDRNAVYKSRTTRPRHPPTLGFQRVLQRRLPGNLRKEGSPGAQSDGRDFWRKGLQAVYFINQQDGTRLAASTTCRMARKTGADESASATKPAPSRGRRRWGRQGRCAGDNQHLNGSRWKARSSAGRPRRRDRTHIQVPCRRPQEHRCYAASRRRQDRDRRRPGHASSRGACRRVRSMQIFVLDWCLVAGTKYEATSRSA